ncbi:MAG TPA: acyl-CoA dehydrogenase family protein, partial [Candidatus Saccharimonadales bacterium]|nr:acyl-CoA dehydrogenase family protein [Candidatus Saccharimonadales bacterium]
MMTGGGDLEAAVRALPGLEELEAAEPATFDEEDEALRAALKLLGDGGILAHLAPASHGGARERICSRDVCVLRETLAYRSGMADLAFVMQGLGTGAIALRGTEAQKERYLRRTSRGEWIAAIGLTEPGAGSDLT